MSLISEQVEARIARAKRAFRQSGRIIDAAKDDLESHTRWLDTHRAAWAEEVKRSFRFLDRKLAVGAFARFAAGAILLLPLALARALGRMAKAIPSGASPQPRLDETAPRFAHRAELQLRIRGLDEPQATARRAPHPGPDRGSKCREDGRLPKLVAQLPSPSPRSRICQSTGFPFPLSVLALFFSSLPAPLAQRCRARLPKRRRLRRKNRNPPCLRPPPSSIMVQKSRKETERPGPVRGFAVVAVAPSFEAPRVPAQTVTDLIAMTGPVPLAPVGPEAAAPPAEKPLATKQAAKGKPKRKLAARPPQPLPWWQQWSWMRLR